MMNNNASSPSARCQMLAHEIIGFVRERRMQDPALADYEVVFALAAAQRELASEASFQTGTAKLVAMVVAMLALVTGLLVFFTLNP